MTERSVEELLETVRKNHADAMMALAADVHPYSASAIREHEEAITVALLAIKQRLAQVEQLHDEALSCFDTERRYREAAERERDARTQDFADTERRWGLEIARAEAAEQREAKLREALKEARPYVYNRIDHGATGSTGGEDWRSQTARSVLDRVDAALSEETA